MKFTNFHKKLRLPFVIYCDFGTLVRKVDTCSPSPETSSTAHEAHFDPCGYAYQVVCTNSKYTKPSVVHRGQTGENVVEHFLESLLREEEYIKGVLSDNEPLLMTKETEKLFRNATQCHICEQPFNEKTKKVRDHNHLEKLVNNLAGEGLLHFKQFTNIFKDQDIVKFLLRKKCLLL